MTTDLQALTARLDAMSAQLAILVERDARRGELYDEFAPIARAALGSAITKLDGLGGVGGEA